MWASASDLFSSHCSLPERQTVREQMMNSVAVIVSVYANQLHHPITIHETLLQGEQNERHALPSRKSSFLVKKQLLYSRTIIIRDTASTPGSPGAWSST